MLIDITSNYIFQKVVSYVYEETKLNLFKYNKNLQNKLNIGLINYMILSKRYIIFQNDGEGKEYNDYYSELIFEGKFFKGKRHGKGKEYDYKGKLIFEGEYINGKRNGRGKEYSIFYKLFFEGEYLNGQRDGKGKEYDKFSFEGEYLYGYQLRDKLYINDHLEYEGEYLYNKKLNGKGYDENGNIIYELINGNGKVKEYWDSGKLKFEGEYLNGQRNGKGKRI